MMSLQEYRTKSASLADFLPWVALVGPGVVLNKDGSFQRTARFRGPDLDSATPAELVAVTSRLNNALRRLGSGWAVFVEAQRSAAQAYPQSHFPDPVSALVDRERREQFREEGAHFESGYYLTLLWMPPPEEAARAEGWLYEGKASTGVDPQELVKSFADRTDRVLHLVGPRGTGKSYVYEEVSPNSILVSGGQTTVANLFYNMSRRQVGLVGMWDVVAFDEVAGINFKEPDGVQIMKGYMANGSFARGRDSISASASMVFVGNINQSVDTLVKTSHLLAPFPHARWVCRSLFRDTAKAASGAAGCAW